MKILQHRDVLGIGTIVELRIFYGYRLRRELPQHKKPSPRRITQKLSRVNDNYTTQVNLLTQCNSYQITNDIFHRTRTKKLF